MNLVKSDVAAIILGAGKGTRMKSDLPKVMMPVAGKPMIQHIIETLETMHIKNIATVISSEGEIVKKQVYPYPTVVQKEQLGTGHAVNCAKEVLNGFAGPILVIFGDTPLITEKTFQKIIEEVQTGYQVVVLGFETDNPARYGRLKMAKSELLEIVEYKDATDEERKINFCNSGCMGFDGKVLFKLLDKIGNENAAHEYYLTDVVKIARDMGLKCTAIRGNQEEIASANTREELAELEKAFEERNNC